MVITFHPHPRIVLNPNDNSLELLNTLDERIQRLELAGVDHLLVIPFDKAFASLSSKEFISQVLVDGVRTKRLVIGYDHHFGKNREGSFENLSKMGPVYGFDVEEIPAKDIDEVAISSSRIRRALHSGDVETANTLLGYNYPFQGDVIEGNKLGRTIGFPTANVKIPEQLKLIPKIGVYAVVTKIDGRTVKGMMNIGVKPTVSEENVKGVEVNLFDWNEDIYGKCIQIALISRIRDEIKFNGIAELQAQLMDDESVARNLMIHI